VIFWTIVAVVTLATALLLFKPLLRPGTPNFGLGMALSVMLPMAAVLIYLSVGSPQALDMPQRNSAEVPPDADMTTLVAELQERMEAAPDDVNGWMLLGRSYRSLQRFDESLDAFQRARDLAPNDPGVAVELAEAMIFAAGPGNVAPEVGALLEQALTMEPELQKALWLSGMVAMQAGNDLQAVRRWETLMPLLEPGSAVASSVQEQLDAARTRLGAPTEAAAAAAWAGLEITVRAPGELPAIKPESALFIIARDPSAPNPPLGAIRVSPAFPATVRLTDANSMLPQRPISSVSEIQLEARLSIDGRPQAGEQDPQSEAVVVIPTAGEPLELILQSP